MYTDGIDRLVIASRLDKIGRRAILEIYARERTLEADTDLDVMPPQQLDFSDASRSYLQRSCLIVGLSP